MGLGALEGESTSTAVARWGMSVSVAFVLLATLVFVGAGAAFRAEIMHEVALTP